MASLERNQGRVDRLVGARAKLLGRLESYPSDKVDKMKVKIAEYEQSLRNFHEFGQEKPPSGKPTGVDLNVPLDEIGIVAKTPEG